MAKTTEQSSKYNDLEKKSVKEIISDINQEDQVVALAVNKVLASIESLIEIVVDRMKKGGRLFYIGAGTSGRLGVLDASECPPTFGVPEDWVIALIAGGDIALRKAIENAEDDVNQAWKDLQKYNINPKDVLIGIAASGSTPYVVGGIQEARAHGIATGCIVCNTESPLAEVTEYPVEVIVGPEYVTGSTRMKSGTAQKLVLNMISTTTMIRLGHVKGNKMVDMQLSNDKLVERGIKIIMEETNCDIDMATKYLKKYGCVRKAIEKLKNI